MSWSIDDKVRRLERGQSVPGTQICRQLTEDGDSRRARSMSRRFRCRLCKKAGLPGRGYADDVVVIRRHVRPDGRLAREYRCQAPTQGRPCGYMGWSAHPDLASAIERLAPSGRHAVRVSR